MWTIAALGLLGTAFVDGGKVYTGCSGTFGQVSGDLWKEVQEMQHLDHGLRSIGVAVDPRSDRFETMRTLLEEQVLPDVDAAVKDCIFGVISLILLTLPLVDMKDGAERARELLDLADRLYLTGLDLLQDSDWSVDPDHYHTPRLLLGGNPTDCAGVPLRIFVYNGTSDLRRQTLKTSHGMMGAATYVYAYLRQSSCLTDDPDQADLFFIPAHHGPQYDEMLQRRIHKPDFLPFLNRRGGVDHFFVVGANLPKWEHVKPLRHAMMITVESFQVNDEIPRWSSPWKDIMIPGVIDRWRIAAMRAVNKPTVERGFILVFHGNHPGTHELYRKHAANVRTRILEAFSGIRDCSVGAHVPDFFERMGRSHFCLVPRGSSSWTVHLYESFFFGCIPIILSDELEVPFQDLLDWPSFSLKWPEDQVGPELLEHVRAIPLARVAEMKRRLEEAACWFDFHRGWGPTPDPKSGWAQRGYSGVVAISGDCTYLGHGDASSVENCQHGCDRTEGCNLVNLMVGGDCVLRSCRDPAQPTLTSGATGYEVYARVSPTDHVCSPYAAMLGSLVSRTRRRPQVLGKYWGWPVDST